MSLECFEKLNLFALELFAVRNNFVYITNGRSHSASFCRVIKGHKTNMATEMQYEDRPKIWKIDLIKR